METILLLSLLFIQTPATAIDPYAQASEDTANCGKLGHFSKELNKCVLAVEFSDELNSRHLTCSPMVTSGKAPEIAAGATGQPAPAKIVNVIICTFDTKGEHAKPK